MARRIARKVARPRYAAASRRRVRVTASPKAAQIASVHQDRPLESRTVAKTWFRRPRNASVFSAFAFAAVLALMLGSAWRDGGAGADAETGGDSMNAELAAPAYDASGDAIGRDLRAGVPSVLSAGSDIAAQARVPTAQPVQLLIPALDVHRAVERVGVNRAGVLNLPANAWNAGWYAGGPVPGAPGDAVIEGHAGYPGQPMIFGKLVMLKPGDHIIAVLADGTRELFLVGSITTVPVGSAPPGMAEPYGPPRLTLITCTGHFDQGSYSYSRRLVLEASYAGRA